MIIEKDVNDIVRYLCDKGIIHGSTRISDKMNGTTDGLVYMLAANEELKYVLKIDNQASIALVEQLYQAYKESPLLPKLLYIDPSKVFVLYSYISGATHHNRGSKLRWMTLLVEQLLNHYELNHHTEKWGRLQLLRDSWHEFNERSLAGARNNIGSILPVEDYAQVKGLLESISEVGDKYFLHGDTGVHNFVFRNNELAGVIDPSPMVGPVIYDFTYAFCSSSDDLNLETLFAAYERLHDNTMERPRLVKEVIFQLYCRIGICAKVHPHDLNDYLKAWAYWKAHLASLC